MEIVSSAGFQTRCKIQKHQEVRLPTYKKSPILLGQVTIIDQTQHEKLVKYLPVFNELLLKYRDYPNILTQFLKICLLLDYGTFKKPYCLDICQTMSVLFSYHKDEKLLNKLVETFQCFSTVEILSSRARLAIEYISSEHANELLVQLSQQGDSLSENALKIKILFSQFNLTKYFKWETLFDGWGEVDELVTCSLLVCCKWYLIWKLRNITDAIDVLNPELANQIVLCSRTCKEFISTTFNMLQNLNGQPLHFIVYECLCDVHITYMKDLERPIKIMKQLEQLRLTIDKQLQTLLVSFLDEYVISNTTMKLCDRRAHVVNYVNLVHHNVLPTECLGHVFKYYHGYYKEFGPIIESSMMSIAGAPDENVLFMVVIYTITIVYENILSKYNVVDIRTEEAINVKLLIKQFLTFKEFRSSKRNFKNLIYFSCKYAFKDESKYAFLYFVKYFVDLLVDSDDRKELVNFLKNKIPNGAAKNDAVLFLANYVKNFKTLGTKAEKPTTKVASKGKQENKKPLKMKKVPLKKNTLKDNASTSKPKKGSSAARTRKSLNVSQETEIPEDDLTIHDSESNDLDESFTGLRI